MNRGLDGSRGGREDGSLESGYHGDYTGEGGSSSMNSSARSRSSSLRSQSTKSSSIMCGASLQRDLPAHWTTTSESVLDIEQQLQTASMIPPRRIVRTTTNDATLRESDKAYHSLMKLTAIQVSCHI
jgi:flagellar basal body P-ring protein FlgI